MEYFVNYIKSYLIKLDCFAYLQVSKKSISTNFNHLIIYEYFS